MDSSDLANCSNSLMKYLKKCENSKIIFPYQTKMINNTLNFKYLTAGDVMTHRIDILAVKNSANILDIVKISSKSGFSRIPVFENNIDNIVGAVFVKDILKLIIRPNLNLNSIKINKFIRSLIYVPKSMKCMDLFLELSNSHTHLAVVVDDFGGTFGIVTMEDIIETIFGQIQDEYDNEAEEINKINNSTYIIQGFASLNNVFQTLKINPKNIEMNNFNKINLNFETIGGFLVNVIGHIPEKNENPTVILENVEFTVLNVEKHHIEKLKAVKIKQP